LDGVRGVAILTVLVYHLTWGIGRDPLDGSLFPRGGYLGVDIFFVLSGFLITTLLIQEWDRTGGISLRHFYARRALRLLPALALVLVAAAVVAVVAPAVGYESSFLAPETTEMRWSSIGVVLLYAANWASIYPPSTGFTLGALGHTWSLAIEEQFYLVWPIALRFLLRRGLGRRQIAALAGMGILVSAFVRALVWQSTGSWIRAYVGSDVRADALLTGCAVGLLATAGLLPRSRRGRQALAGGAAIAAVGLGWIVVAAPPANA